MAENLALGRGGKRLNGGIVAKKTLKIGQALRYARLLQDDFRQPDDVRIPRVAPRQVAFVALVPTHDFFGKRHWAKIRIISQIQNRAWRDRVFKIFVANRKTSGFLYRFVSEKQATTRDLYYTMKKYLLLLLSAIAIHAGTYAQLRIPNVLSDNMVLQRKTDANIWGWGWASTTVSVKASWLDDTVKTQVDGGGRWILQVPTGEAGGPYELTISAGGEQIKLENILLGDVWLCSGQSNMEWGGN